MTSFFLVLSDVSRKQYNPALSWKKVRSKSLETGMGGMAWLAWCFMENE
jgi:hypothetical protein